jgi:hypothetical protein
MNALPMLGNLAWAPVPAIENVEVLDRFNGVPTFGLFTVSRYVTIGMAKDYRLIFEREWQLPENAESQRLVSEMLHFLLDALRIALAEDMPPARRELVFTMSQAVEELASA